MTNTSTEPRLPGVRSKRTTLHYTYYCSNITTVFTTDFQNRVVVVVVVVLVIGG